jgi:hypothetical protein
MILIHHGIMVMNRNIIIDRIVPIILPIRNDL